MAIEDNGIRRPAGLGPRGTKLWCTITALYELRPDEVELLTDAAREADVIERLEDELKDSPLVVKGSMGQPASSPLVTEIRQHRATLKSLLAGLRLGDVEGGSSRGVHSHRVGNASEAARRAVRARWDRNSSA
jgi:hypothetical protein